MRLYILKRIYEVDWDENNAKIVRAINPNRARTLANLNVGDEGYIWGDPAKVTCKPIRVTGKEGVVITDFKNG